MSSAGTLELVAIELSKLLEPLATELGGDPKGFLADMGFSLSDAQVAPAADALKTLAAQSTALLADIAQLIPAIDASDYGTMATRVIDAINKISGIVHSLSTAGAALAGAVGISADQVAKRIFDYLTFRFLENSHGLNDLFELSGMLDREDHDGDPATPGHPPFTIATYHFDQIGAWFNDPFGRLRALYGWGNGFDGKALLSKIEGIVARNGFPVIYDDTGPMPKLDLVLLEATPTAAAPRGLKILLKSTLGTGDQVINLGTDASLDVKADFNTPLNTTLVILPGGDVTLTPPSPAGMTGNLQLQFTAQKTAPPEPFLLFGAANGSRIQLGKLQFTTGIKVAPGGPGATGSFFFTAEADSLAVIIDTSSGDGFLQKILPSTHLQSEFNVQLAISTDGGLHFNGSGALEVRVPCHIDLGPISIEGITIDAALTGGKIPVSIGADVHAELGPLQIVVQNMGLLTTFSFPANNSGNLGPLQFDLGFKPPDGAGLSVDAGIITGGGFLSIDSARGQYAGVLQFVIAGFLGVTAIGLIKTKMPDGSDGLLAADHHHGRLRPRHPARLRLHAAGRRRPARAQPHDAVPAADGRRSHERDREHHVPAGRDRERAADHQRPAGDSSRRRKATFLIGPMAKLGWGEPTLISLSLGVIIEIPPATSRSSGCCKLALPRGRSRRSSSCRSTSPARSSSTSSGSTSSPRCTIRTSCSSPSTARWACCSPTATTPISWCPSAASTRSSIRRRCRSRPRSASSRHHQRVLCAHPLRRLLRRHHQHGAVRRRIPNYFFGFSALSVEGHSGFDALIQFSPFHFIVRSRPRSRVKVFGIGVYGVGIDLTLEGPTPWHAHGTASLSFFFFSIDIGIDFTWGDSRRHDSAGRSGHADPRRRARQAQQLEGAAAAPARTCSCRCASSTRPRPRSCCIRSARCRSASGRSRST